MLRANKKLAALLLVFIAVYLAQTFLIAPNKASLTKYHISTTQSHLLSLTIVIPYVAIWITALIGYLRLKTYAQSIHMSKDGAAFATMAKGIGIFALWLPLNAIFNSFATHYYGIHPSASADLVRLGNYINSGLLFPAFYLVYKGSQKLLPLIKRTRATVSMPISVTLTFIALSALYVLLVLSDPARNMPTKSVAVASYYQPDWLIVTSLVIPRLLIWFLGVKAVHNVMLYRQKVKGSLYKKALNNFARGIAGVVLLTIALRIFQSTSSQFGRLGLGAVLLIVYILLAIISYGYILVAKGARNLQKLEDL